MPYDTSVAYMVPSDACVGEAFVEVRSFLGKVPLAQMQPSRRGHCSWTCSWAIHEGG